MSEFDILLYTHVKEMKSVVRIGWQELKDRKYTITWLSLLGVAIIATIYLISKISD